MTLVIYKDHRIEIDYENSLAHYAIFAPNGFLVAEDSVEMKKRELIVICQLAVDEFIKNPERFRNGSEDSKK